MDHRIPTINKKIFRTPRERLVSQTGGANMRLAGRAALYQGATRTRRSGINKTIGSVLVGIAIVLVVQSFFQIPAFRISDITIDGIKYISSDTVRSFVESELNRRRFVIFKNSNYFLFAKERMQQRLADAFYLDVVSLEKRFPRSLHIVVRERISAFVVQTPDGYFALGRHGEALSDVQGPTRDQLRIADERSEKVRSVPLNFLEQATRIAEDWATTVSGFSIAAFHLNDDTSDITISTDKGFRVLLDPEKDIHSQLVRLSAYLQDRESSAPSEYIDLRYDETLYIR